jgi:hypothetical protein
MRVVASELSSDPGALLEASPGTDPSMCAKKENTVAGRSQGRQNPQCYQAIQEPPRTDPA